MSRKRGLLIISMILFTVVTGCKKNQVAIPGPSRNESLIVLPSAESVYHSDTKWRDELFYTLKVKYPAESVIRDISEKLNIKGWTPLKKSFLNPEFDSSYVRGWGSHIDSRNKSQIIQVFSWSTAWMDEDKNLVTYTFKYTEPFMPYTKDNFKEMPSSEMMYVHAYYESAESAKNSLEFVNKMKKMK